MVEVGLKNIRARRREARGTIGQVITPHAPETLVETEPGDLIGDVVEAAEPPLQRIRIVQTETVELGDLEASLAALLAQSLRRQQHAAGKYVGLAEVRPPTISLQELVSD